MKKRETLPEDKAVTVRNTAVIVFHGMGQQVPFETLGEVAEKIRKQGPWSTGDLKPRTVAENVPCRAPGASADATLSRIRMTFTDPEKENEVRNIDFHESYWAPVTAGKVTFRDVLVFLIQAGIAGIRFSLPSRLFEKPVFSRFFWNSKLSFPLPYQGNLVLLAATLAIVGSLAGLILGLGLAIQVGSWKEYLAALSFLFRALHIAALPVLPALMFSRKKPGGWAQAALAVAFLAGLLSFLAAIPCGPLSGGGSTDAEGNCVDSAIPFQVLLGILAVDVFLWILALPKVLTWLIGKNYAPTFLSRVIWFQSVVMGVTLVGGVAMAGYLAWQGIWAEDLGLEGAFLLWTYGILGVVVVSVLRKFLIEYVGDVAAYLSTHKAGKFSEIRSQILADAFKVAGHVFASGSSGKKNDAIEYSEVMFVGHSLGSVIAYDTLNGIISQDLIIHAGGWRAAERTKLLLTFGSPLDKTAFIFRTQVKDNPCREMLASAKQPLLEESHAFRPAAWVNVWSHCDIISGPLEFYDRGRVRPDRQVGDADGYAFTYDDTGKHGQVEVVTGIEGAVRPDRRPRPVISLIDPQADIPYAAHTQFWKNDLIYRILTKALQDPGDGSVFGEFIRITSPKRPGTP